MNMNIIMNGSKMTTPITNDLSNSYSTNIVSKRMSLFKKSIIGNTANNINIVKNKPVQNKPVQNKPVQNKPAQNKPVKNKPVQNKPVQKNTVHSLSVGNHNPIKKLSLVNYNIKSITYNLTPSTTHRIYILCYNQERLEDAKTIYSKYSWAFPILMKYQDYTWENAFWKQLQEIKHEWINYRFVGVLSHKAYQKINLDDIDKKINSGFYNDTPYVHFADLNTSVVGSKTVTTHPNFLPIWLDVLEKLSLNDTTESLYNYFMCTPSLMQQFIDWYLTLCLPTIIKHPLIFTNARYNVPGSLTKEQLIKKWGKPYYPHLPFVLERLFKNFFFGIINTRQNVPINSSKIAFLFLTIGDASSGGARTLITYINYLNNMGYSVDIYFGNCLDKNISIHNLDRLISNVNKYGILNITKNNFYLGTQIKRDYDLIVANAWQISEAAYRQKYKAKKIAYIIQDREELFYPNDYTLQNRVRNTYKPEYNYYCLSKYLANYFRHMFPNGKITDSVLGFDSHHYYIKKKHNERNNCVVIAYYKSKPGRLPELVDKIIRVLSQKYKCYIFPERYDNHANSNIINCGSMNVNQLNDLYNNNKVGIVFSNSNPSRLGFEMVASGLNVIEYDSEFTKYDLDKEYFTLIKNENNIMNIVNNLMNKIIDETAYKSYIKKSNNEKEKQIICDFFKKLL